MKYNLVGYKEDRSGRPQYAWACYSPENYHFIESVAGVTDEEEIKQMRLLAHWYANGKKEVNALPKMVIETAAASSDPPANLKEDSLSQQSGKLDKKLKRIEEVNEGLFFDCVVLVKILCEYDIPRTVGKIDL
jgi:hypothetical protein